MGMSATQARYLSLIAQQSDLEFQGQQINESRTTLSEQTNNLYSQLQDLSVPTPPHTTDFTTIQYTGSLGADNFTIGKVVPSGSTYSVNLDYNKAGNSTYSVGKAQVTETPEMIKVSKVKDIEQTRITVATIDGQIGYDDKDENVKDRTILHKVTDDSELKKFSEAEVYVKDNDKFIMKDRDALSDEDYKNGVYVKIVAEYDDDNKKGNYTKGTDYYCKGTETETVTPSVKDFSSYYVMNGDKLKHATASDFKFNKDNNTYEFIASTDYYKLDSNGDKEERNPDYEEGIGKSLAGNPLMEAQKGLNTYLTEEKMKSAIEALRNGFPEYADYSDAELLNLFYVSFSDEGSMKVPHFVLKTNIDTPVDGAQSQWAEYYDITTTGTYTKTETKDGCDLTFDTSGRITEIAIPIKNDKGETIYQKVKLTATSVTDEQAYEQAYNDYEYEKFEYDKEQQKINGQMSIIQQEDKKLELKLQRLDNERTQITTEIEALEKVINDNIEASYKTFSG